MDAYSRHKDYMNNYVRYYGRGKDNIFESKHPVRTDMDVIRQHHKFIRTEADETGTWEATLAKKYYDKLFKEYCVADLSRYKEGKIGFRWRTQKEVIEGKGQFSCGNKRCDAVDDLRSYEVNFAYVEDGEKKNALVKVRLCPPCAYRLNYKQVKAAKRAAGREARERARDAKRLKTSRSHQKQAADAEEISSSSSESEDDVAKEKKLSAAILEELDRFAVQPNNDGSNTTADELSGLFL
eukprot:GILJ01007770.1.p1 GENE.GILJ01007770.1~~GILJ01007770.1.p1  ORF type:complete len:239 (+),score=30.47 GILJ01007770.1:72-788(+)